jgi:hypothetical protein
MTQKIIHQDIVGHIIEVGDIVVSPTGTMLELASVKTISPKMITVFALKKGQSSSGDRRYPSNILVVTDDPKVSLALLKINSK